MQHRASDGVVAGLCLGHADGAFVDLQHALRDGLNGVLHRCRRPSGAHRPVGDRADLEQQRAAACEELACAVRAPRLHHAIQRSEQQQPAASGTAEAVDLAEQIDGLRQVASRPGVDDIQPGDVAEVVETVQRDGRLRLEHLGLTRDRAVERLHRRPVELPYDVVAPVEAAQHRVERTETGADSLLGWGVLKHCCRRAAFHELLLHRTAGSLLPCRVDLTENRTIECCASGSTARSSRAYSAAVAFLTPCLRVPFNSAVTAGEEGTEPHRWSYPRHVKGVLTR